MMRWALLTLCAWPAVASADTVVLGDGDTIEGKVSEHGQSIRIEMDFGTVDLPRSEVVRIERSHGKLRAFEARLEQAGDDVSALLELARWARTQGLERRARDVYRHVLILDPENVTAHRGLDHVKVEGRWLTQTEAKRAAGYVRVGGVWLSAEEAAARRRFTPDPTVPAPPPVPGRDPAPTAREQLEDYGWLTYWYPGWWGSWGYWRWAWGHHLRPRPQPRHRAIPGQPGRIVKGRTPPYRVHRPLPRPPAAPNSSRSTRQPPVSNGSQADAPPARPSGSKASRGSKSSRSGPKRTSRPSGRPTSGRRSAPIPRTGRSF